LFQADDRVKLGRAFARPFFYQNQNTLNPTNREGQDFQDKFLNPKLFIFILDILNIPVNKKPD
jgi:hypothetical protein